MANTWCEAATGEAHGYRWQVIRCTTNYKLGPTGWWHNGYVGIPKGHPWRRKNSDPERDAVCHGGITHAGTVTNFKGWCVGFDCNHVGDALFGIEKEYDRGAVFRDQPFAIRECERLCAQAYAAELADSGDPVRRFPRAWEFFVPHRSLVVCGRLSAPVVSPTFVEIRETLRALRREEG